MSEELLFSVGLAAGLVQLLGYVLYLSIKGIEPNPITWLMFSYGTVFLTVLEWDKNATFEELFLPMVCSVLGIVVMVKCWRVAYKREKRLLPKGLMPQDNLETLSFAVDVVCTIGYIMAWVVLYTNINPEFDEEARQKAVFIFLFFSNLTVFSEFFPIIKSTWKNPEKEHWAPWAAWTLAYCLLSVVTYSHHGWWSALMMYPVFNALTHGAVALLALPHRKRAVMQPRRISPHPGE